MTTNSAHACASMTAALLIFWWGDLRAAEPKYVESFRPGPVQVISQRETIWWFIQFDRRFVPTGVALAWDHPVVRKKGGRQWIVRQHVSDLNVVVSELDCAIGERVTFNPNVVQLFCHDGEWYAFETESMFNLATVFRRRADGCFSVVADPEKELGLARFESVQPRDRLRIINELKQQGGCDLLYGRVVLGDGGFTHHGRRFTLNVSADDTCFQVWIHVDGVSVRSEPLFEVCNETRTWTADEIDALPDFLEGERKP